MHPLLISIVVEAPTLSYWSYCMHDIVEENLGGALPQNNIYLTSNKCLDCRMALTVEWVR
jgi:hypothetical protein